MYSKFWKRFLDLLVVIMILPILLLVSIVIIPIIIIEDFGSPFYISDRLGKKKKVFKLIKFRSMRVNSKDIRNDDGSTYNSYFDDRITKVGKILRKLSVDELPQLINVLLGNMSIVGPRPDLPDALKIYNSHQIGKLNVKPGITGYSQAFYRNSITPNEKFNYDTYYAENVSLKLDLKIIVKTIRTVLFRENIYRN